MNIKTYYIVDRDVALASLHLFLSFHFVDLDNGQVLLSAVHRNPQTQDKFEQHCSAEALPHVFDPSPISDKHAQKLASLGIKKNHSTKDVAQAAKAVHRLM